MLGVVPEQLVPPGLVHRQQLDRADEYSLAVVHTLVGSLSGLLDPYVKEIVIRVLKIRSELVKPFFLSLVENIGVGSLIKLSL